MHILFLRAKWYWEKQMNWWAFKEGGGGALEFFLFLVAPDQRYGVKNVPVGNEVRLEIDYVFLYLLNELVD